MGGISNWIRVALCSSFALLPMPVSTAALAQGSSGEQADAPPFESVAPGQSQPAGSTGDPSSNLKIGVLHWAPIESQCSFTSAQDAAPVMEDDGTQPLVFVTMASAPEPRMPSIERGYIMANGIVRELERGRSAPNAKGTVTTVWRSAGEPRISVSVEIDETRKSEDGIRYDGQMTVNWGDKKEVVAIGGRCLEQAAAVTTKS